MMGMKRILGYKRFCAAALAGMLLLNGCTGSSRTDTADAAGDSGVDVQEMSEQFDAYMNEIFLDELPLNTVNLHYTLAYPENYGITDYDVCIGRYSLEEMEESYQEIEETRERMLEFDREKLTEEQKITYDIVMDHIDTELSAKDLVLYSEILGPTTGYQAQLPVILAEYTFRTERDIEDYLELLTQMDELFAEIIVFEQKKSEAGLFMSDAVADEIIDQCEEFIADPEHNYMIDVFNDKIEAFEGITEEEREEYRRRNTEAITTDVMDAFGILIDGLTELKGSGTNELGLCYYDDGREYYEYLVRSNTGSAMSVEEMKEETDAYIDRCLMNMLDSMYSYPELEDEIYDYEFPVTDPEEILIDLQEKIKADFPEMPDVNYTIKKVHPSMEEHESPAFYLTTPIDDSENHVIYINDKYLGEDANMDLYTTLAHEGYPGHLYQDVYTNSCGLAPVRSLFSYSGYAEGWATYVENYAYGLSGLDKELAKFLAWNNAATLGLYAYADMGIHYDGWGREELAAYLSDYGYDEEVADEIFDIIVEEPAVYLRYFVGYLEIIGLRNSMSKKMGDDFTLKDFHQFMMEIGPAPFDIIEAHMDTWIKNQ